MSLIPENSVLLHLFKSSFISHQYFPFIKYTFYIYIYLLFVKLILNALVFEAVANDTDF